MKRRIKIEPSPGFGFNAIVEWRSLLGWMNVRPLVAAWGATEEAARAAIGERLKEIANEEQRYIDHPPTYIEL